MAPAVLTLFLFLLPFLTIWPISRWLIPTYRLFNAMMFGVWLLITATLLFPQGVAGFIRRLRGK